MEIIKQRELHEGVDYQRHYAWREGGVGPNGEFLSGFGFACHPDGKLIQPATPAARENLRRCLDGVNGTPGGHDVVDLGVTEYGWHFWDDAVGRCSCGREVTLSGFTNTCRCGRDYNSFGQQLAPRHLWGEETNEHPADIARIR